MNERQCGEEFLFAHPFDKHLLLLVGQKGEKERKREREKEKEEGKERRD